MQNKPKLVVLDDNDIFAALLVAALEGEYDIRVGRNGKEGEQLCLAENPELLITDIGMPEVDGVQMLQGFQKDSRLSKIPVIIVTATHFSQRNRSELECYPQVRAMFFKTDDIENIVLEIRKELKGRGN
jgi:CheY-like chemotaxis protein